MSDFYLKIKTNDNELEIATSEKNVFDEKIKEFFALYFNSKSDNNAHIHEQEQVQNNDNVQLQSEELCDFIDINSPEPTINDISSDNQNIQEGQFEKVLENVQNSPNIEFTEPELNDDDFVNFINSKSPDSSEDYLIYSAIYLNKNLNQTNFTLKQINSKLVPLKGIAINHKTLNTALENGLIEPVYDLTETTTVKEYALTQKAESEYGQNCQ